MSKNRDDSKGKPQPKGQVEGQEQPKQFPLLLLLCWIGLLLLFFRTPPQPRPDQGQAASTARSAPLTVRTSGPPIDLHTSSLHLRFSRDGSLVAADVLRYGERIVGFPFWSEDAWTRASAQGHPTTAPCSAGVHLGRALTIPADLERKSLATVATTGDRSARFESRDPDGRLLPKGLAVVREYKADSQGYTVHLGISIRNESKDVVDLTTAPGPIVLQAGPLMAAAGDIPEAFSRADGKMVALSPGAAATECTTDVQWVGARNQYFAFVLDRRKGPGRYLQELVNYRDAKGSSASAPALGFRLGPAFIKPGQTIDHEFQLYLGPKVEAALPGEYHAVFNNWDGSTGWIGRWMFLLLQFFHTVTGSYGIAILLLTFVVKVLLHPLNVSQTINMQRMQELQPKLKKLKDQIKDSEELQKATIKLYQDYNVNPLGGCLPALIQVPIFIALYWCLRGAIELKGVSFWWIKDLSMPDPTTILALVFALSIYLSGKMMQPTAGPGTEQQQMMNKMMPVMMYVMFVFMPVPAGVMLYMAMQSLLGVVETQYNLSQMPKKRAPRTAGHAKGDKRSDKGPAEGRD